MSNAQGPIKKNITFSANFFRVASLPAQSLNMKLEFEADEHWTVRYEFGYGWQNNGLPYYHLPATISAGVNPHCSYPDINLILSRGSFFKSGGLSTTDFLRTNGA